MCTFVSPSSSSFRVFSLIGLIFVSILPFCSAGQGQAIPGTATQHPLITQTIDETALTTLRGNTHPLARPMFDLGMAPASLPMQRMLLVLKRSPEQDFALRQLLDGQQDRNSPNYHRWMTPEEFGQQFGPTDADMQTITTWLQSHGFEVGTTKGRTALEFSGSASQVAEAFHTTIHKYVVNGEQHWANASDPSIPTALVPAVAGIVSLHNFEKRAMNEFVGRYSVKTKQISSPKPNYTFTCGGGTCYGVVPYDFATIYDVLPLWNAGTNGTGQSIAIVGRTDINPTDATTFWSLFGLTVPANKLVITVNGDDPGFTGDEGEADIDVQWSGAVAPQATIKFVTSKSTLTSDGVDLSALYIVDNDLAPVMSESYGECELGLGTAGNQFFYTLWSQAAAQGISVFVSSGDNGSAGCDDPSSPASYGLAVNGIASTPYNAAVGGTDFNQYNKWSTYWNTTNQAGTEESAKGYIPETTWNDSCTNALAVTLGFGATAEAACNNPTMLADGGVITTGGSGGPSNCVVNQGALGSCTQGWAKPTWQTGNGVPNDQKRDLPDISLLASNGFMGSFYVICQTDVTGICDLNDFLGYGGTSVASPAFAGIMSLVNQKTGSAQGVPGFALYQLVSKQANAFHDVPTGSTIAMPCYTGSLNCTTTTSGDTFGILTGYATTTAYDLATGLGSVDATNLVNNWTKATFTATTTTLTLNSGNPVSAVHGTAVPVSISVNPTAAKGNAALLVSTGTGTTTGQAIDMYALSSGGASGTTSLLPGGSYNVIAHYSGDGTYGGSYSTLVPVTISKENPTLGFSGLTTSGGSGITSVPYDSAYWVTLDVESSAGKLCSPLLSSEVACPTGTVTLTSDGNPFQDGTYSLGGGEAHVDTSSSQMVALSGGTHTLKAQYNGDTSYAAGSKSFTITVTKANTRTDPPNFQGTDYTQPVYVSTSIYDYPEMAYDAAPTGTVTFYNGATALPGTVTYGTNGQTLTATLATTFSAPGTYQITATYGGDQNYQSSQSSFNTLILQYPTPAGSLTPDGQIVQSGGTATLTATFASANKSVYPTGTVWLVNASTQGGETGSLSCNQAKDSSGNFACQVVLTFSPTATTQVYARYSGDTNYPATNSPTVTVNVPDFQMGTSGGTFNVAEGQSVNFPVTITATSGFNGVVSGFSCTGLPAETSCSFSPTQVTGSGSTTLTISTTPLGQMRRRAALDERGLWFTGTESLLILGACVIGIPAWRKRRGVPLVLMLVAALVLLPSCGGSGSGGGGGNNNNPVPSIASLSPAQIAAGSQTQTLTIDGTGFLGSSTVTYNGIAHTPSYQGASKLSIQLQQSEIATIGQYPVVVTNPAPGGGSSAPSNLGVVSGTPTGTFQVTVNATSGSTTHSITFNLVVQ